MKAKCLLLALCVGCSSPSTENEQRSTPNTSSGQQAVQIDSQTGVPYATTFQFPLDGFDASDFGFSFGGINDHFCLSSHKGECLSYGAHLGRDSQVKKTPVGTPVYAPADGIVRISTTENFGAYGSDSSSNPDYRGCLILLEHEFLSGQSVLSLLGHIQCEANVSYDTTKQTGNPSIGTIVRRGQYLGHVAHYWSGSDKSTDWHHLHWGMRKGPYVVTQKSDFVVGYALPSTFHYNVTTHAKEHETWLDPFVIVAAYGDPEYMAGTDVRFHPPGSLLKDSVGQLFVVKDDTHLAPLTDSVAISDRYDVAHAVLVTDQELSCYTMTDPVSSQGAVLLYRRLNTSTVVMASLSTLQRQDFVRWEALLSWGFTASDVQTDPAVSLASEALYVQSEQKKLRPGSLVKADNASEVCIVRPDGKRQPIASADVFEALGYVWEQVYSIPAEVLEVTAGERLPQSITWQNIHTCAVPTTCTGGKNCGGGADPCSLLSCPQGSTCSLNADGKASCSIQTPQTCTGECIGGVSEACIACPGVQGTRTCSTVDCQWSACYKPSVAEECTDGIDNDCNGVIDCHDPACASHSACLPESKPDPNIDTSEMFALRLQYSGEKMIGSIVVNAWWQPPAQAPRVWAAVTECSDVITGDGLLDCVIMLPHGTTSFEFQLDLPNGGYWGDTSCYVKGGCGKTNGVVTLSSAITGQSLSYEMIPNVPGEPYLKGHVSFIP
ncbi:M23 family metallopeptidase [Candidatus Uhrbacteria bacterium]|nr:M23 family metallopeptidase [Candidatus Uhrbacteria bacterium]